MENPSMSVEQNGSSAKKDLMLAGLIGLICGLLIQPIIKNIEAAKNIPYPLSLIIVLPILCILGMWVALFIAKKIQIVYQLAKFVLIGILNTLIDWGVLNLLMYATGVFEGAYYDFFKGISFAAAVANSYPWNKYWTFKKAKPVEVNATKEFLQFIVVSVIGFLINLGIAHVVVNIIGAQFGLDPKTWATAGAFCGTVVGLFWNFLGYKLIVFR